MESDNKKSDHILNASSNLIGFSFVVLTTIQALHAGGSTIIDELAALEILFFSASSFFSFLAIRSRTEKKDNLFENIADAIFFLGLLLLFIAAFFIFFSVVA